MARTMTVLSITGEEGLVGTVYTNVVSAGCDSNVLLTSVRATIIKMQQHEPEIILVFATYY